MLIDTHAHLNFPDFEKDLEKVIERAGKVGVAKIICVSSNVADAEKAIQIAKAYPGVVFAAVGLHPQQTDPENKMPLVEQVSKLARLARSKEVVAIGECGLDYSPSPPGEKDRTKKDQLFLFEKQIELAQKLNLPIIIHCRKAFADVISTLLQHIGALKRGGVFHCYSAGKKGIEKVNQLEFLFGVDGNLTYDPGLQNVFKQIPLEKILLETDAPFLAPEPFRGQRNEPAHVKIIAKRLAKSKGVSFKKVCQITSQNAQKLFQI